MRPPLFCFFVSAALCGNLFSSSSARADAFSPIPTGDPIYRQLSALGSLSDTKTLQSSANLTRYEAALQVARAAAIVGAKPEALGRSGWRSLRDLTLSLKGELRQLGVDVNEVLAACSRQLDAPVRPTLPAPAPVRSSGKRPGSAPAPASFLNPAPSPSTRGLLQSNLNLPLLGRTRVEAALLAMQRDTQDPLFSAHSALGTRSNAAQFAGKSASVGVDVNSWLRVGAMASERRLGLLGDNAPALNAPLFAGAREARGFGGSLQLSPVDGVSLSTEVERLSTDLGTRGTRFGGGIGLSAWQNRLTLSAHLSRLQPEDRAALPATATELNLGVGVTQRLSLNLLYQGLFSSQSETSRLAGGLNFRF